MFVLINTPHPAMASEASQDVSGKGELRPKPKSGSSAYWDRVKFISQVLNPVNLLASNDQIDSAMEATRKEDMASARQKALVAARVHPDTGKLIFLPFSVAAIIPTNLLIVLGMMRYTTNKGVVFWQIANQSLNTGVNAANANKSGGEQTREELLKSYTVSVLASCSMSLIFKAIADARKSAILKGLAPMAGVMGANVVNVGFMRGKELTEGIAVKDENGVVVGMSKRASRQGIIHTIESRNTIAACLLALPPLTMHAMAPFLKGKSKLWWQIAELAAVSGWMLPSVPMGIALFPQQESAPKGYFEPEIASLLTDKGYFNRGF